MAKQLKKRYFTVSRRGVFTPFNKKSAAIKEVAIVKKHGLKLRVVKRTTKGLVKQKPFNYYKKK